MIAKDITEQLDELIDGLLLQSDIRSSSMVSMLTAVRESAAEGYHVALARRVWDAHNALKTEYLEDLEEAAPSTEVALPAAPVALAK